MIMKKVMSASFADLHQKSHAGQERVQVNAGRGKMWPMAVAFALGLMAQSVVAQSSSTPSRGALDATERKTLVVLGDSLAAGYGVDPAEAYPAVLQRLLDDAGLGFRVV